MREIIPDMRAMHSPTRELLIDISEVCTSYLGLDVDESARPELVRARVVTLLVHQIL
jgi:hypothetical protein